MWGRRGRWSLLYLIAGVAAIALLSGCIPPAPLNTAQLDDGRCGHNLQLGSDNTASSSNKPWFALVGDGGLAAYDITIDGRSIGTFNSDAYGKVCINTTTALADGSHTLAGKELRPKSFYDVAPYTFKVDTTPPPAPSKPALNPARARYRADWRQRHDEDASSPRRNNRCRPADPGARRAQDHWRWTLRRNRALVRHDTHAATRNALGRGSHDRHRRKQERCLTRLVVDDPVAG
jgi:hypothetical protein